MVRSITLDIKCVGIRKGRQIAALFILIPVGGYAIYGLIVGKTFIFELSN